MESGEIRELDISPQQSGDIVLPIKTGIRQGGRYFLKVGYVLKEACKWADRGYEIGFAQFELPSDKIPHIQIPVRKIPSIVCSGDANS